jgi:hypothetical protein
MRIALNQRAIALVVAQQWAKNGELEFRSGGVMKTGAGITTPPRHQSQPVIE